MAATSIPQNGKRDALPETAAARSERLAVERDMIEQARQDLAAGRCLGDADLDAWLDALVRGDPVDLPEHSIVRRTQ